MESYNLTTFLEYCLTENGGGYDDNASTCAEASQAFEAGSDLLFPNPVSSPNGEEGTPQIIPFTENSSPNGEEETRQIIPITENALTEQAYEWEGQLPYDGSGNWLGTYESCFDGGYWGDGGFSHGNGVDTFRNHYLDEEQRCGYYSYEDEIETESGYDYNPWFGAKHGVEEDWHGTDRAETTFRYSWDEMKLCESIFGHWPCLSKDYQEPYFEEGSA